MGVTRQSASELVYGALGDLAAENAERSEELRELENERLDSLLKAWWQRALDGDAQAASIVLRTIALRSRINGLIGPGVVVGVQVNGAPFGDPDHIRQPENEASVKAALAGMPPLADVVIGEQKTLENGPRRE